MKKLIPILVLTLLVWEAPLVFAGQAFDKVKTGIVKEVHQGSRMAMVEHNGAIYKIVLANSRISRKAIVNAPINFVFFGEDGVNKNDQRKPAGKEVQKM
ncbi:MAG: hypothetical protein JKY33_00435 [Bacteroidia bacterium]|nr:hypothetical protein [Bacteroidia bacterium]